MDGVFVLCIQKNQRKSHQSIVTTPAVWVQDRWDIIGMGMIKYTLMILAFVALLGCSDNGLSPKVIIEKCKKCEEQGMNVKIYSNVLGRPFAIECVPTKKQKHP